MMNPGQIQSAFDRGNSGERGSAIRVMPTWIEGNDSSERGLPVYEPLTLVHDDIRSIGDGFLPMIADALQRLTAM
jgi:hypothetical protein